VNNFGGASALLTLNSAAAEIQGRAKRKGVWGKEFLPFRAENSVNPIFNKKSKS